MPQGNNVSELNIRVNFEKNDALKQLKSFTNNLKQLKTSTSTTSKGFNEMKSNLEKLDSTTQKTHKSFLSMFSSLEKGVFVATKLLNAFGNLTRLSNDYIETLNIFSVSMGSYTEQAKDWAEQVQSVMGIDSSEFMKNWAVFKSITNGFGLGAEASYEMSKGLTELAYDLSSLFNADVETSFLKLRSAITGEIKSIRQWGGDMTEANLSAIAQQYELIGTYSDLSQAQKSALRYEALVRYAKAIGAVGDMARTISSPANAIRVLKSELQQLGRQMGNVFLPLLAQILPYLQAITKVLTDLISKFAILVGFKVPEWNTTTDWNEQVSGIDDTTNALEKLKKATLGFDELNVINKNDSNEGGASINLEKMDIKSLWDQSILDSVETQVDKLYEKIKGVFDYIGQPLKAISFDNIASAIERVKQALAPITDSLWSGLYNLYNEVLVPLAQWTIEELIPDFLNEVADVLERMTDGKIDNLEATLLGILGALAGFVIVGTIADLITKLKVAFEALGLVLAFVSKNPLVFIVTAIGLLIAYLVNAYKTNDEFKAKVDKAWNAIKEKVTSVVDAISKKFKEFNNWLKNSTVFKALSTFGTSAGNMISSISRNFKLPFFAEGGTVNTGQLFVARESGAELVGNIGGTTSVMNNEQIVQAVSKGVAQAVASVMGNNGGQDVVINLDGKVLAKAMVSNINQMTRQNGYSPLVY